jgi:hypothetical protein
MWGPPNGYEISMTVSVLAQSADPTG